MSTFAVAVTPTGLDRLGATGSRALLQFAVEADEAGIDQICVGEHVVMAAAIDQYPGAFPVPLDHEWYDPIALLSAMAAVTERVRLSTSVLLGPLRSAVLLAKQLATLDQLSEGRLDVALGVGWQRAEYEFSGLPWDGRFGRLDEQVRACRALWSAAPASFDGKDVQFDGAYSLPFPVQTPLPIWYGLGPSDRNFRRLAEHADGWALTSSRDHEPEAVATDVRRLRRAFEDAGRDPAGLGVRMMLSPVTGPNGRPDLEGTLAAVAPFLDAGVTILTFRPAAFCSDLHEVKSVLQRLAAASASDR